MNESMAGKKILIVEDEPDLAEPLVEGLVSEGYKTELVLNGQEAIRRLSDNWDLVILDLMLPDMTGESLVNYMRQQPDYPPILILTARSGIEAKLALFRQGCDDYLTKPFIFEELVERVRALLRRSHRVSAETLQYKDLVLEPQTHKLSCSSGEVILTPKEATLIRFFLSNAERIVSRKELLNSIWGLKAEPETNFIGVHMFNLRKKLSEIKRDSWLQTVRSSGFILAEEKKKE